MTVKTLRQIAGLVPVEEINAKSTALVLIDLQMDYFTPGKLLIPEGDAAVSKAADVRAWAKSKGIPVIHIQQLSNPASPIFGEGSPGAEIHPKVAPADDETVITKGFPSSFCGTTLKEKLTELGVNTLIIVGMMTHMCVDSTTREAIHQGYKVILVSDACATRDLPSALGDGVIPYTEVHKSVLSALADRFADVMPAEAVMGLRVL